MATSWTQADITKLELQIANWGATKSITFADQTYTKDDLPALMALLAEMRRQVGATGRVRLAAFRKGA